MSRKNISTGSKWEPIIGYSRAVRVREPDFRVGDDRHRCERESGGRRLRADPAGIGQYRGGPGPRGRFPGERGAHAHFHDRHFPSGKLAGKAHGEAFGAIRPATTMVQVAKLIDPAMLVNRGRRRPGMIKARGLSKTFRVHRKEAGLKGSLRSLFVREWTTVHALKGADLDVGAGEIVGLVGANGAGKTTLVKALSGILYPSGGTAEVLGHVPWQRKNEFRRQIALIMGQEAQLWWDLPAGDGFMLLREISGSPGPLQSQSGRARRGPANRG